MPDDAYKRDLTDRGMLHIDIPRFWAQVIGGVLTAVVVAMLAAGIVVWRQMAVIDMRLVQVEEQIEDRPTYRDLENTINLSDRQFSEIMRRFDRIDARLTRLENR